MQFAKGLHIKRPQKIYVKFEKSFAKGIRGSEKLDFLIHILETLWWSVIDDSN